MVAERYECTTGHNKFWEVWVENSTLYRRWGRIGTDGQTSEEKFSSPNLAEKERGGLVKEKLRRGYKRVNSRNAVSPDKELLARYEPYHASDAPPEFIKDVAKLLNRGLSKQMKPENMRQLFDILLNEGGSEDDKIKTLAPDIAPLMKEMASGYDYDISEAHTLLSVIHDMYRVAIKSKATKFIVYATSCDGVTALCLVRGSDSSQRFSNQWLEKQIDAGRGKFFS